MTAELHEERYGILSYDCHLNDRKGVKMQRKWRKSKEIQKNIVKNLHFSLIISNFAPAIQKAKDGM